MDLRCNTWEFEQFESQTVSDHQNLQITFQVLNVERPLISVGKLATDGCEISFDSAGGFIHRKGGDLRFKPVGDMFGIRVRVLGKSGGSNFVSGGRNLVMPTFDESSGSREMSPLESGEAEPPHIRRPLMSPSDAEKRRHEASHLPFREWCEHCVRGRGRAMPHFSRQRRGADESVPVVQLDNTYTSTGNISSCFFILGGLIFLCSYSFWRRSNYFLSS